MKHEIKVPNMGESISEAVVADILKSSGNQVQVDEEILELETDKVNQVLYAPAAGKLSLSVSEEDTVEIDQVIGYVDDSAVEDSAQSKKQEDQPEAESPKDQQQEEPEKEEKPVKREHEPKKSSSRNSDPSARFTREQFAEELQREPIGEKKTADSIDKRESEPKQEPRSERREKMSKIRKVIAHRLVEAQQNSAMLTTFNEVDMSAVMELRNQYKDAFLAKHEVKLGFMSFFVKACVAALQELPGVNARIEGEEIVYHDYCDIGIAVGTDRGLVVPVVRNCENLSLHQIEGSIVGYAKKAHKGGLSVDDLRGGTFTITNGGVYGSLLSTPILNPPQSGILGMHKIEKRPVVVDGEMVIRPMMYLALSYDHRIVDGKEAVTFLVRVKEILEDPRRLLLEV